MSIELITVAGQAHWRAYHDIRRHVLFELRGQHDYNEEHPDEHRQGHIPFLLLQNGTPVGTVRLDLESKQQATVRLVAIVHHLQGRGLGRAMMSAVEKAAMEHGVQRLRVHSAPAAVAFYTKVGWVMADANAANPIMMRYLTPQSLRVIPPCG